MILERDNAKSQQQLNRRMTRRQLLGRSATGVGIAALGSLLGQKAVADPVVAAASSSAGGWGRAKRVIFLTQAGAPSQMELFDYKPALEKYSGRELPDAVRMGQRLTSMTADQKTKKTKSGER